MASSSPYSQTLSASQFLSGIGVDTHVAYTDGLYAQTSLILQDLNYLGVDQVRDGISDGAGGSAPLSSYIDLAEAGVHFTFIIEGPDNASLEAQLGLINQVEKAAPGSITAIEGPNEINNEPVSFGGASGLQAAIDMQTAIVADVKADTALAGVPVDYFTGYNTIGFAAGPDPVASGLANFDNQHPYPPGDQPPAEAVSRTAALGNTSNPNEPAVYTETGYSSLDTNTYVQQQYELDLIMDVEQQGISKTYLYQLMDAYAPGSPQGNDGSGLFDYTKAAKPVATAIHNLTSILSDPNASPSFTATPLAYSVSGLPSSGNSLAIEKSDGSYTVVVWAEPELWDASTKTQLAAPTETVTITLPSAYGDVSVYDPTQGTSAIATYTDQKTITVAVTDHPILIQVSNPISAAPPPVILTGVAEDGLLQGASVFADASGAGTLAAGDVQTTTNAEGQFSLTNPVGRLVVEGGVDAATQLPFVGALEAPAGSSVVTPLTTLVSAILSTNAGAGDVAGAEAQVLSAFGLTLSSGQTLTTLDPISGVLAGDAAAKAVFSAGVEVIDTAEILAAGLAASGGVAVDKAFSAVITSLASAIQGAQGQRLDLTNASTLQGVIQTAAAHLGVSAPGASTLAALATLAASSNAYLQDGEAPLSRGAALQFASAVELVDQGSIVGALSSGSTAASLLAAFTGTALANAVTAAEGKVACFLEGSRIATPAGERRVEDLQIGDLVMTASGQPRPIKWIGRRRYREGYAASSSELAPILVKRGAIEDNVPSRDLFISPNHALFIDGLLLPAATLINEKSIVQVFGCDDVQYHHIELDRHDVIFASGAAAETFLDDDSRGIFNNIEDYFERYPDDHGGRAATYFAERVESGAELQAITRRLSARAGRLNDAGEAPPLHLKGFIDIASPTRVEGWAFDPNDPSRRLTVVVLVDELEIERFCADTYREDLEAAGFGDGAHAFARTLSIDEFSPGDHRLEVRFADDWSLLGEAVTIVRNRPSVLGPLHGAVDLASRALVSGWAQDMDHPDRPVGLEISFDGEPPLRLLANQYRKDLHHAGLGHGRHGFEILLPKLLAAERAHTIHVRREADGCELTGSPILLAAGAGLEPGGATLLPDVQVSPGGATAQNETKQPLEPVARSEDRPSRRDIDAARHAAAAARRRLRQPAALNPSSAASPKRALIIDERWPDPARDAGSVAVLSHARALQDLGYEVLVTATAEFSDQQRAHAFANQKTFGLAGPPNYSCVEDVLRQNSGALELVYLHRQSSAQLYLQIVRAHCPAARIVYSVADLHHVRLARQATVEGRSELLAVARGAERAEIDAALQADIVLTHSPAEAAVLKGLKLGLRPKVAPYAALSIPDPAPWAQRQGLAFIGGAEHAPNRDAVNWLAAHVLPALPAAGSDQICQIVGQGWRAEDLPRAGGNRLKIVGPAGCLSTVLAGVRATTAPLRYGAGIKGKVIESLAAGVPCVMSTIAAEGLELSTPLQDLVVGTSQQFADRIFELLSEERSWLEFSLAAQAWAQDRHSQAVVTAALGDILQDPRLSPLQVAS